MAMNNGIRWGRGRVRFFHATASIPVWPLHFKKWMGTKKMDYLKWFGIRVATFRPNLIVQPRPGTIRLYLE